MNRAEAIIEGLKMGREVYVDKSTHAHRDGKNYDLYCMIIDSVFCAAGEDSWESCLKRLNEMNFAAVKAKKRAELKKQLEELEGMTEEELTVMSLVK